MKRTSGVTADLTRFTSIFSIALAAAFAALAGLQVAAMTIPGHGLLFAVASLLIPGVMILALWVGHETLVLHAHRIERGTRDTLISAHRDALTNTHNRAYFLEALGRHVGHTRKDPLTYIQIDLDHLKALNDGAGHATGDAALIHLVEAIQQELPDALIGRLGGDEFAVALPGHAGRAATLRICRQIQARLSQPVKLEGRQYRLSATMGVAIAPDDASSVEELISKADLALYQGKKAGRKTIVFFERDMNADERYRRFVERELRAAILMNEVELYYQPIYGTNGRELRSYEALMRWPHPVRGMIPPSDFVPIAERSELIDILGEWVLRRACQDLDKLNVGRVGVNVSAAQLKREDFAVRFAMILEEEGVSADRLTVEITESVPLRDGGVEIENLSYLRNLGVRVAIDDFGAGHASLSYLKQFDFDVLKIDKCYLKNVPGDLRDYQVLEAICGIARANAIEVIAEGVETEAQLSALQQLGCEGLQGYLLGRPAPLAELLKRDEADSTAA